MYLVSMIFAANFYCVSVITQKDYRVHTVYREFYFNF